MVVATGIQHPFDVVTRNVADFAHADVTLTNL